MIPKLFIEEITRKTDIEALVRGYVELTRIGAQLKGKCPFCLSSSFTVSVDKQIYKCFKCTRGGGALKFVQEIEKKKFVEAVQFLAGRLGMIVPDE